MTQSNLLLPLITKPFQPKTLCAEVKENVVLLRECVTLSLTPFNVPLLIHSNQQHLQTNPPSGVNPKFPGFLTSFSMALFKLRSLPMWFNLKKKKQRDAVGVCFISSSSFGVSVE
ncbi:unnamed protein product [Cuscuta campestris]|uniref:Uncharacterized protein n=1 Tax=Cuscuta campestris TaxID=132261 RepID=A0A484M7T5_9ASTE|nr:unnamed protein product [Cuscuta campestris]